MEYCADAKQGRIERKGSAIVGYSTFPNTVFTSSQSFFNIRQKNALITPPPNQKIQNYFFNIIAIEKPGIAPITYYKGAPIIMIMRPKASLTDCYVARSST